MTFCKSCGEKLEDGAKFCHKCGIAIESIEQVSDVNDIDNNRIMAIMAYLGILVIVPLMVARDSHFVKFHANQGVILLGFEAILIFLGKVFSIIPFMGLLSSFVYNIGGLCAFILLIIGVVNVFRGEEKRLPIIGEIDI